MCAVRARDIHGQLEIEAEAPEIRVQCRQEGDGLEGLGRFTRAGGTGIRDKVMPSRNEFHGIHFFFALPK